MKRLIIKGVGEVTRNILGFYQLIISI